MREWKPVETAITIGGKEISEGESMTIRVALEAFASYLQENGLGDDESGQRMKEAYLQNIVSLRNYIFGKEE